MRLRFSVLEILEEAGTFRKRNVQPFERNFKLRLRFIRLESASP